MTSISASRLCAVLLSTAACVPCSSALAQDAVDTGLLLDPITIQIDRRGEPLKDQPRAVTVIGGNQIPAGQVDPAPAIADQTPGLVFSGFNQPGQDFLNIRGMGPLGLPVSATDHVVGYSIDEVPTSTFGFPPVLFDMEQIEIARGPQGTLFGRNALAGGLNFVPNRADGQSVRNVALSFGTDGYRTLDLVGGGWLAEDRLAARIALHFANYDGTIPNTNIGGEIGGSDEAAGRLSLSTFTDTGWTVSAMAQFDRVETNNSFLLYYEHPNFPESGENAKGSNSRDNKQATVRIEKEFERFRFTSLTGWQDQALEGRSGGADIYLFSAFTGLPDFFFKETDPTFFPTFDEDERILSQEFRLASPTGARASWVVGANYFSSDYDGLRVANDRVDPAGNGTTDVDIDTMTWSIFGDGTLPVGDRLRISAGIRYGYEKQSFDGTYISNGFPGTVPFFSQSDEISDTYTTGRLGLSYDITDDLAGYASISRGYAAGGFEKLFIGSSAGTSSQPFEAATNNSIEVGLKYQTPDSRADVTLSAYANQVKNGQLFDFAFTGPTTLEYFFVNQDYDTKGIELEGRVELAPDLMLRGAVSVLDTEFVNTAPGSNTGVRDGNEVPLAPNLTTYLAIDYRLRGDKIGINGDVLMGADWSYVGERQADAANRWQLPSYHLVNARIGWAFDAGSIYVFVNNLLDERPVYTGAEYAPNVHAVSVGPGRIIGVGGEFTF